MHPMRSRDREQSNRGFLTSFVMKRGARRRIVISYKRWIKAKWWLMLKWSSMMMMSQTLCW